MNQSAKNVLNQYLQINSEERDKLLPLINQLETSIDSVTNRKTFTAGHITASALILSRDRRKLLMIAHGTFGRLMQPGGHVEPDETSFVEAAMREAREETGIQHLDYLASDRVNPEIPLDIDVHKIPAHEGKNEAEHLHYDFRYLFMTDEAAMLAHDPNEVDEARWIPIDEIEDLNITLALAKASIG